MEETFDDEDEFEDEESPDYSLRIGELELEELPKKKKNVNTKNKVKIISTWNFKGGVGKTTFTFGLAYSLAHTFKKKVLMIDADPQKNLTQLIAQYFTLNRKNDQVSSVSDLIMEENNYGFYKAMSTTIRSRVVRPAQIFKLSIENVGTLEEQANDSPNKRGEEIKSNLWLLNGSYRTALLEKQIREGYKVDLDTERASSDSPIPAVFWNLVRKTATAYGMDYVIVDLSPAISDLNTNILFSSHAFVMPCAPELFSIEALKSVPQLLKEGGYWKDFTQWRKKYLEKRDSPSSDLIVADNKDFFDCPPLDHNVQFAGVVITRYLYRKIDFKDTPPYMLLYRPSNNEVNGFLKVIRTITKQLVQGHDTVTSLPSEMVKTIAELGWANDDPNVDILENGNFRLVLDYFPELNMLSALSQKNSIPAAYLPNRILEPNNCLNAGYKVLRWCHRQALERICSLVLTNFFDHDVDSAENDFESSAEAIFKEKEKLREKKKNKKRKSNDDEEEEESV
jgi:cellulose biosynthesis protein BcsQ